MHWTLSSSPGQHLRLTSHCWIFRQLPELTKCTYIFLCICLHPVCIFPLPRPLQSQHLCLLLNHSFAFLVLCFGVLVHTMDQIIEVCFLTSSSCSKVLHRTVHTLRYIQIQQWMHKSHYQSQLLRQSPVWSTAQLCSVSCSSPCCENHQGMLEPQGTRAKSSVLPVRTTRARDRKTLVKFLQRGRQGWVCAFDPKCGNSLACAPWMASSDLCAFAL